MGTLDQIYSSAVKFLEPQTLQATYSTAVKEAISLVQADYGTIFLGHKRILNRVYTNIPIANRIEPRKNGNAYKSFKSGKILVLSSEVS